MADASSSDTTSEYFNESFSDISSEKSTEYVIGGHRTSLVPRRSRWHFLQKLFNREIRGSLTRHNYAAEEKLFASIPSWRHLSLVQVIPNSALQAGHIIMGLTQCGRFLLTYTYSLDVVVAGSLFKYLLHWWSFTPNRVARKVAEVTLFGNYSIYKELSIVIAQWPTERNKLVIHGLCSNWTQSQQTDKAFLTITTVPSLNNCKDCLSIASSYEEEDLAASWDTCVRCNCLKHGLTVHTTYEVISPYPKFRAVVCLNYANHVVLNTGNFLHVLRVDLSNLKGNRHQKPDDGKPEEEELSLDMIDLVEADESKLQHYMNIDEKCASAAVSPKCDSITESDFNDEVNNRSEDRQEVEILSLNSSSNQSDYVCDNKCNIDKSTEQPSAISVRDKILQDFCEDMSQELSFGSDMITLVKHPPCSPRSAPQRLPPEIKSAWSPPILTPPSDILKTRNSESSHRNTRFQRVSSPQPDTQPQQEGCFGITTTLHTSTVGATPGCSARLMSPPITRSLRHSSTRKRSSLNSTHKLTLEAEKAYEFTDEAQEACEKLSSFRKRRLADKKYEFCDEAEDAENIVPFKHVRDQFRHRGCTMYSVSPAASPCPNGRRHRIDSDHSESDDLVEPALLSDVQIHEAAEKNVLRPLNQNHLPNGLHRDRYNKLYCSNTSPLVPKATLQYPIIKCTAHFRRSYIDLDDEMTSVITDVEDEETGGYASYQCVLPMQVHGADYMQMQMINNAKAEKLMVPCVSIHQLSFDIETFSHHIADWQCKLYKKKYWHCSDYDIEIIDVCVLTGDIICLLIMKIQTSEQCGQGQCTDDRKQYVAGCKFTWNIDTSQYRITDILPMKDVKSDPLRPDTNKSSLSPAVIPWNPTKFIAPQMREKIQQPYARSVRYLHNEMTLAGESITRLRDLDNLVEFYITPLPNSA